MHQNGPEFLCFLVHKVVEHVQNTVVLYFIIFENLERKKAKPLDFFHEYVFQFRTRACGVLIFELNEMLYELDSHAD